MYEVKSNHSRSRTFVEMTADRVAYHLSKLIHGISLRENGVAQSMSFVPTLGRLFDCEDDFRVHRADYTVRVRLFIEVLPQIPPLGLKPSVGMTNPNC